MIEQIEALLTRLSRGDAVPGLAQLEDTLTEGYAHALALEAELWRLERRRGEPASASEAAAAAERVATVTADLAHLRAALGALYERTRAERALVNG